MGFMQNTNQPHPKGTSEDQTLFSEAIPSISAASGGFSQQRPREFDKFQKSIYASVKQIQDIYANLKAQYGQSNAEIECEQKRL